MNDITISPVSLANRSATFSKPVYLISFEDCSGKKGSSKRMITIDKPDTLSYYVQTKGILTEASEEEILSNYQDLLTAAKKEDIIEVMIPWNRIFSIRSLVFKAK